MSIKNAAFILMMGASICLLLALSIKTTEKQCTEKNVVFAQTRKVVSGFYKGNNIFVESQKENRITGPLEGMSRTVEVLCSDLE